MNKKEYFTKIAENVTKERKKGEYTAEELRIYREGRIDALKGVLLEMQEAHTYGQVMTKISAMQKFLKNERNSGKLATLDGEKDIWTSGHYTWSPEELMDFIFLNVNDYRMRLKKAREIHTIQTHLLNNFTQLEIE